MPPVFSRNADGDEASEEDSRQHSARSEHIQRVDWKVRLHRVGDERADEKSAQNGREHHNATPPIVPQWPDVDGERKTEHEKQDQPAHGRKLNAASAQDASRRVSPSTGPSRAVRGINGDHQPYGSAAFRVVIERRSPTAHRHRRMLPLVLPLEIVRQ